MDRETFAARFLQAAVRARDFARTYIEEDLPDEMRFRLRLNSSYDANLVEGETVYPEDSVAERAKALRECAAETVVETLWRNGTVPEWADLAVMGRTEDASLLQVMVCGRFTASEGHLYHAQEGYPPFHVTGPCLPVGWQEGQRFSLYDRSECWDDRDLELLQPHAAKVWSLELHGDAVDDAMLDRLPVFPKLEILELRGAPVRGQGLAALARHPKLRVLRAYLPEGHPFDLSPLPKSRAFNTVDLSGLPSEEWGFDGLYKKAPNLKWLTLNTAGTLVADGRCPGASYISLTGRRLQGLPKLPKRADHVTFDFPEFSDELCEALLKPVRSLRALGLRGSPVSEAKMVELIRRFDLDHLAAVDCGLSDDAARRIAALFPNLRLLPNLAARDALKRDRGDEDA